MELLGSDWCVGGQVQVNFTLLAAVLCQAGGDDGQVGLCMVTITPAPDFAIEEGTKK